VVFLKTYARLADNPDVDARLLPPGPLLDRRDDRVQLIVEIARHRRAAVAEWWTSMPTGLPDIKRAAPNCASAWCKHRSGQDERRPAIPVGALVHTRKAGPLCRLGHQVLRARMAKPPPYPHGRCLHRPVAAHRCSWSERGGIRRPPVRWIKAWTWGPKAGICDQSPELAIPSRAAR